MSVRTQFSIKDLENLSGIKAHTIRIWEKRYKLLEPNRTDTNIRFYNVENLMRLLNVTYLYTNGYKISKISKIDPKQIGSLIQDIELKKGTANFAVTELKVAMLNFDQALFHNRYNLLAEEKSFREIFHTVFLPFLRDIGLLWQTGTIDPAHEHFISELIKQKIVFHIEKASAEKISKDDKMFVFFLPLNEIHEIGLLYLHYEILSHGYKTVYLGTNMPVESLQYVSGLHKKLVFVSYFTIQPEIESYAAYLDSLQKTILNKTAHKVWMLGKQTQGDHLPELPKGFTVFKSITDLVKKL